MAAWRPLGIARQTEGRDFEDGRFHPRESQVPHDIIDNRHEKLVDHIQRILPGSQAAKFAVGHFSLVPVAGEMYGLAKDGIGSIGCPEGTRAR